MTTENIELVMLDIRMEFGITGEGGKYVFADILSPKKGGFLPPILIKSQVSNLYEIQVITSKFAPAGEFAPPAKYIQGVKIPVLKG